MGSRLIDRDHFAFLIVCVSVGRSVGRNDPKSAPMPSVFRNFRHAMHKSIFLHPVIDTLTCAPQNIINRIYALDAKLLRLFHGVSVLMY